MSTMLHCVVVYNKYRIIFSLFVSVIVFTHICVHAGGSVVPVFINITQFIQPGTGPPGADLINIVEQRFRKPNVSLMGLLVAIRYFIF